MSGPKVVRIVTREEIIAICEGHLARLEQSFEQWARQGRRLGQLNDADLAATRQRHRQLQALLAADQFVELQKAVPQEIEFLSSDRQRREAAAVAARLDVRQRQRRIQETAVMLVRTLKQKNVVVPADLASAMQTLAAGDPPGQHADATLAAGLALLTDTAQESGLTEHQARLADRHRADMAQQALPWRAPQAVTDARLTRIEQHLAELETLDGTQAAAPFQQRLLAINALDAGAQQNLLLDSLVLDVAQAASKRRHRDATLQHLRSLQAEILRVDDSESLKDLSQAIDRQDLTHAAALIERSEAALAAELKRVAAVARRAAVLNGLASLGYEVREGMETAWASEGRVTLRKTATPGYGVEVGGAAEAGRLQVRAVALSNHRDLSRDRDIETLWCGEFSRLQTLLARNGDALEIEKALGVGAVPLKVVELDDAQETYMRSGVVTGGGATQR